MTTSRSELVSLIAFFIVGAIVTWLRGLRAAEGYLVGVFTLAGLEQFHRWTSTN